MGGDSIPLLTPEHPFLARVHQAIAEVFGRRLASLAVFGSVARRTARPDSDLDLFVVVDGLPRGRRARTEAFAPVEESLRDDLAALERIGVRTELSPVLRTPEDLRTASPLLLDLTEDAVILEDRGELERALADLRRRLEKLGAKRIWRGTTWYWDLKPDYRRGEIIHL